MSWIFNGDETAPFFGFLRAAAALVFSCMGTAYGTANSGVGVASMGVMRSGAGSDEGTFVAIAAYTRRSSGYNILILKYSRNHSTADARALQNLLEARHSEKFQELKGCVLTNDVVGSCERVGYSSQGSGLLKSPSPLLLPAKDAVTPLNESEAIHLVKTCSACATEMGYIHCDIVWLSQFHGWALIELW